MPVWNSGRWLRNTFSFLYKLDPQPEQVVFLYDGSTDNTLQLINKYKKPHYIIIKDSIVGEGRFGKIAKIRQCLLEYAREYDPTHAVFVDSDIFIRTANTLQVLALRPTDITGGSYPMIKGRQQLSVGVWNNQTDPTTPYLFRSRALVPFDTSVIGVGTGCMSISQRLIQDRQVNFYPLYQEKGMGEDTGYCKQALLNGYTIGLDSTILLSHFISPRIQPKKPWHGKG